MITPFIVISLLLLPSLMVMFIFKLKQQSYQISQHAYLGLALTFLFFASGRLFVPMQLVEMLPPWVPLRLELVYASGLMELAIAVALLLKPYRIYAALLAFVVLVGFFPINIYSAFHYTGTAGQQMGPIYLLIRAPLQLILISWAYFMVIKPIQGGNKRLG
ncbi:DoxX family protein [Vibrio sonorensis]|uniref:DoxX family protein n=1 Tax=Vibrio sonorensis TaxID=1004316 RepID=UPI0008D90AE6|nr:hypothetical protein [Vibrio sonorensis]